MIKFLKEKLTKACQRSSRMSHLVDAYWYNFYCLVDASLVA